MYLFKSLTRVLILYNERGVEDALGNLSLVLYKQEEETHQNSCSTNSLHTNTLTNFSVLVFGGKDLVEPC